MVIDISFPDLIIICAVIAWIAWLKLPCDHSIQESE